MYKVIKVYDIYDGMTWRGAWGVYEYVFGTQEGI